MTFNVDLQGLILSVLGLIFSFIAKSIMDRINAAFKKLDRISTYLLKNTDYEDN